MTSPTHSHGTSSSLSPTAIRLLFVIWNGKGLKHFCRCTRWHDARPSNLRQWYGRCSRDICSWPVIPSKPLGGRSTQPSAYLPHAELCRRPPAHARDAHNWPARPMRQCWKGDASGEIWSRSIGGNALWPVCKFHHHRGANGQRRPRLGVAWLHGQGNPCSSWPAADPSGFACGRVVAWRVEVNWSFWI